MTVLYKVTYKQIPITKFGLEVVVVGEDMDIVEDRFEETIMDFDMDEKTFKIWKIERV